MMNRGMAIRGLVGLILAGCLLGSVAGSATANTKPSYRLADGYPRVVGRSVNSLETIGGIQQRRKDLAVLDAEGHQMKLFRNDPVGSLSLLFRRSIPESIGGWAVSNFYWGPGYAFAVTNPRERQVTVIEGPLTRRGGSKVAEVADMGRPARAVYANYSRHNGRVEMPWITANPATDDISIHYMNFWDEFWLGDPLPVGDKPVDLRWIRSRVLPDNHHLMITVNKGSDDLTMIDFEWIWDKMIPPTPSVIGTVPVGDAPVDILAGGRNVYVVNQGSDSLSHLRFDDQGELYEVDEYPVGVAPTAVSYAQLNSDDLSDLVVANGGSDSISFLLSDGSGGFQPAGRMKVGDKPVEVKPINYGRFFVHDLAVANAGDGTISILEWNETSGTCAGEPARLYEMNSENPKLFFHGNPGQVIGSSSDDDIRTGVGGDCVDGGEGHDVVFAAGDADQIYGGPGDDQMSGGLGPDLIRGGPGDDFLCENLGYSPTTCALGGHSYRARDSQPNVMYGGPGNDTLDSGKSVDRMFGGPGDDTIISSRVLTPHRSPDRIDCGPGHDVASVGKRDQVRRCEVVKRH